MHSRFTNKLYRPAVWLLILCPLVFAVHHAAADPLVIGIKEVAVFVLAYGAAAVVLFLLTRLLFRSPNTTLLFVCLWAILYLFWGYWYDGIIGLFGYNLLTKIPILFTLLTFLCAALSYGFHHAKTSTQHLVFKWLMISAVVMCLYDGMLWFQSELKAEEEIRLEQAANPIPRAWSERNAAQATHWNVYILLYDALAGSSTLKKHFNYDNSPLDSFLKNKGFKVIPQPIANYQSTTFSMASFLNARYLLIPTSDTFKDRSNQVKARHLINSNAVVETFKQAGYAIHNYSIFDFEVQPSALTELFVLPVSFQLLQYNTFYGRLAWYLSRNYQNDKSVMSVFRYNEDAQNLLLSSTKSAQKHFTYAHFMLPHLPYHYDSIGNLLSPAKVKEVTEADEEPYYLYQIPVARKHIMQTVTHLLNQDSSQSCILVMSDHGYGKRRDENGIDLRFYNYAAIYFPDKNYSDWGDSLSNVNMMRKLMNRTLGISLKQLPDSMVSYFVQDDM